MGERKVLNKYYPPDFDPAKIPRRKQPKNQQINVRMMLPMSICCEKCGNYYIYKGTKFNSRKEDVVGETYLGIQIFRFYFKCTRCSSEITMKTGPKNSDYTVEFGAKRNFEPWRAEDEEADGEKRKRESEEIGDVMKSLENKTIDSKREMDILATLDELKSMRSRHAGVNSEELLGALLRKTGEENEKVMHAEDEALVKSIYGCRTTNVVRIDDYDSDEDGEEFVNDDINQKKRKVCMGSEKPTDYLTKKSFIDLARGKYIAATSKTPQVKFKSAPVTIKVVKKPLPVPSSLLREHSSTNSNLKEQNMVLKALGQNYDSDQD